MLPVPTTKRPRNPIYFKEFYQFFDADTVSEWLRMGGADLFREMVCQFTQDVVKCLQELDQALTKNNPTSFAHTAHGLKGICQHMGAKRWASFWEQLEDESMNHFSSNLSSHVGNFRDEFLSFMNFLNVSGKTNPTCQQH